MRVAILTTDAREAIPGCPEPQPRIGIAPEALLQGFARLSGVEVHVVSCLKEPLRSVEKIAPNIFYHGVTVPRIGWLRTGYQGCIRAVRKKLKEIQPDIVHGQGTERYCAISAAFSGFPNVVTIHGNMRALEEFYRSRIGSFHWLAARLETLALRKTAAVFCNSAYTERLVAPQAKRVWRVPNALRAPFFDRPLTASRPAPPILLNIGSLAAHKRQLEILGVARKLWQRGFRFELQFAGYANDQNDYTANFLRQIREAESAGYARHLGELPLDQLITTMDAASALLHFPGEEAFGLVVAEALARNLKLFAGATGGVVDIAADIEGAELFSGQDWPGLEKSLARWLETGCPRSQAAAAVMRQRYTPEIVARRHPEIYRQVLESRG